MRLKTLLLLHLVAVWVAILGPQQGFGERVPVIFFLPNDGTFAIADQLRTSAKAGNPDPQPAVLAAKAIGKRKSQLTSALDHAKVLGLDTARYSIAANAVMGWCERDQMESIAHSLGAADFMEDRVLGPQMNVSVPTMLPDSFHNAGYRGQVSAFDIGVLDAGIDGSHPAFDGLDLRYHIDHTNAVSSAYYDDSSTDPDDLTSAGHGTHIAGIICGRSAPTWEDYTGLAPGTGRLYNLKSGFRRSDRTTAGMFFSDALDNIDWAIFQASDDIDLLNFSWGLDTSSDDSGLARFFDAVVVDLGIPVTVSAGNGGPSSTTIIDPAIAYNVITVGATNDVGTILRSDDNVTGDSARGPTVGGRKKPDLVAPGYLIQSPTNYWETNYDFSNVSGTSFAAPHVIGAVQLIMDYYGPSVQPLQVKALLIGSASPGSFYESTASVEWDAKWGWGYVNLERAWEYRNSVFLDSVNPAGQSGDYKLYRGTMSPVERAALVWNRHVNYVSGGGEPSTAGSLNDLNMRLYDHSDGTLLDASTSGIDNVEVVTITAREYETVLKVYAADSSFSYVSSETYGLCTPPGFTLPSNLPRPHADIHVINGTPIKLLAFVENTGDFHAHHVESYLNLPSGVDFGSGLQRAELDTVLRDSQEKKTLLWTLVANEEITGNGSLSLDSSCYGETYSGSAAINFTGIPTGLSVIFDPIDEIAAEEPFQVTAHVRNSSASLVLDASISLIHAGDIQIYSGAQTIVLGPIGAGQSADAQWTIAAPEPARTIHAVGVAQATTAGGGVLGGRGILTLTTPDTQPEVALAIEPVGAVANVTPGSGIEYKARCTNLGPGDIETAYVSLDPPTGFVLVSGSVRQNIGPIEAGQTIEAGRWLVLAPQQTQTAEFRISADDDHDAEVSFRFDVSVGKPSPPPPSSYTFVLQDDPTLQDWTSSSDNDPAGLCMLSDGSYVFFNGQNGGSVGHDAMVRYDPELKGTAGLSVFVSRASIQQVLGTSEEFTIDGIAVDTDDNVYALVRIIRDSGKDPRHLIKFPGRGEARSVVPPGLPPYGILFNDNFEASGLCWDQHSKSLLLLVDNEDTASDTTSNGVYTVDLEKGTIEILHTYESLAPALTPSPRAGIDPIGFTSMAVDALGALYLLNSGGTGGNRGDIIRVPAGGAPHLFLDDSTLILKLPVDYADFPVRLIPNRRTGDLAVLVCDTLDQASAGEATLTEWDSEGSFIHVLATRSQLLTGTGSGLITCPAGAAISDRWGRYHIWAARDNETLLIVPGATSAPGNGISIY